MTRVLKCVYYEIDTNFTVSNYYKMVSMLSNPIVKAKVKGLLKVLPFNAIRSLDNKSVFSIYRLYDYM